ncbi:hypothetical protein [Chroococcidiopsis sp. CCMEE 29]|uniref:hypothetical protein n=1 Tax=Chroococcidiopsis sp. CCMEE 29 TaxID=155894 RepID=UPI002020CBAB|nr:hypothetical protein [Chroococcidiopsis sp. CCMEE 29]
MAYNYRIKTLIFRGDAQFLSKASWNCFRKGCVQISNLFPFRQKKFIGTVWAGNEAIDRTGDDNTSVYAS